MSAQPLWPWRKPRPPQTAIESLDRQLDAALDESFPSSDPPSCLLRQATSDRPLAAVRTTWPWNTLEGLPAAKTLRSA